MVFIGKSNFLDKGENFDVCQKSDAIFEVFATLGFPFYLCKALKVIPACIRNYVYDTVGCYRYRLFGRLDDQKDKDL